MLGSTLRSTLGLLNLGNYFLSNMCNPYMGHKPEHLQHMHGHGWCIPAMWGLRLRGVELQGVDDEAAESHFP